MVNNMQIAALSVVATLATGTATPKLNISSTSIHHLLANHATTAGNKTNNHNNNKTILTTHKNNSMTHHSNNSNSNTTTSPSPQTTKDKMNHAFELMTTVYRVQLAVLVGVLLLFAVCSCVRCIRLRNYRKMATGGEGAGVAGDDVDLSDAGVHIQSNHADGGSGGGGDSNNMNSTPSAALTDAQFQSNM